MSSQAFIVRQIARNSLKAAGYKVVETQTAVSQLTLPTPYPLQLDIMQHPAKRKVWVSGRRSGKTTTAALMAIGGRPEFGGRGLLDGKRVMLSSTSQDQADTFWEYITEWLSPLVQSKQIYKNESRRILRYRDGRLQVKTGRDPDALRSGFGDLVVLDECAYLDPEAWRLVVAPMLADTDGTAVFISTPKRRNWLFQLYQQALTDETGRWAAWNFPTTENPHLSQSALDALIADMTEEDYQQEILAQFLEGQGAVFRYVDERCAAQKQAPYPGRFVFGVDWGKQSDYTVIVVMDTQTRQMVDYDRFNGVNWSLQRGRLAALYDRWKPTMIWAESNSIGSPNIEALQAEGLPVRPFETTAVSKTPLIESLVLAFDRGEITCLNDPILKGELMAYERKVSATGRSQYSAPAGLHDDCVMALAIAWYGAQSGSIGLPLILDW